MSRGCKKLNAKKLAYTAVMRQQVSGKDRQSKTRWIRHTWDEKTDSLVTRSAPGFFPRASQHWHREGSLDEIEQRENAGQREMF